MSHNGVYKQPRVRKWMTMLLGVTGGVVSETSALRPRSSIPLPSAVVDSLRAAHVTLHWDPDSSAYHRWEHLEEVASAVFRDRPFSSTGGIVDSPSQLDTLAIRYAALFHDYGYNPAVSQKENLDVAISWMKRVLNALWPETTIRQSISLAFLVRRNGVHVLSLIDFEVMLDKAASYVAATAYSSEEDVKAAGELGRHDLGVLTCGDFDRYGEYSCRIRQEYGEVPNFTYAEGRLRALEHLRPLLSFSEPVASAPMDAEIRRLRKEVSRARLNVLLPGNFDPIHKGHIHALKKAVASGYDVTVGVYRDSHPLEDHQLFSQGERMRMVEMEVAHAGIAKNVQVIPLSGPESLNGLLATAFRVGCSGVLALDPYSSISSEGDAPYRNLFTLRQDYGSSQWVHRITLRDRRTRALSSTSVKEQVRMFLPTKGVSSRVRSLLEGKVRGGLPIRPILVAGGIGTGKSALCSLTNHIPSIDMDSLGRKALDMAGLGGLAPNQILGQFYRSPSRYLSFMDKLRPHMMALLCSSLQSVAMPHSDKSTVYIQVNTLGLLWSDLLRVAGGRVILLEDIDDEEAARRIGVRGSSLDTMRAVRALEASLAPSKESLEKKGAHVLVHSGATLSSSHFTL